MPRDIPVGNGRLLVNFDADYCLRDIYYPHVGHENHTAGHKSRVGVWVDGRFGWISRDWKLQMGYRDESLITDVRASDERLGIEVEFSDCVDHIEDIFIRKVTLKNLSGSRRELRIFFHHDFHIMESSTGDTAYYDPDEKAVIHYKGKRYFLISGQRDGLQGLDQYSTGVKEFRGLEGTWRDAEDGLLEGNAIAQGSVDSVAGFTLDVPPGGEMTQYFWLCAGGDFSEVSRLHRMVMGHGVEYFIKRTENYWRAWVNKEEVDFANLSAEVIRLYKRSLLVLRTNIDRGGAVIAGADADVQHYSRDTYGYMWPRDGALTAYALDMAGYHGITRRFYDFLLEIIKRGKESVGYFLHKYNPDGSLGSSWHGWTADGKKALPIQEDGTALVLWALWHHFERFRDIEFAAAQYESLIRRCGDFLASYVDERTGLPLPSYDLWEEKWGVHTFTASAVYAGLIAASKFSGFLGDLKRGKIYAQAADSMKAAIGEHLYSAEHGRFLKSIVPSPDGGLAAPFERDPTLDASIYAPFYFGVFEPDDQRVQNTMTALKEGLRVSTGGMARYEGDAYYKMSASEPGNPWFICTLWIAQWHIARAKDREGLKEAADILEWVASRALPSGVLAEQAHPVTGEPLSVSPLTWSHAAFVTSVHEYLNKYGRVHACPTCGSPMAGGPVAGGPFPPKVEIQKSGNPFTGGVIDAKSR